MAEWDGADWRTAHSLPLKTLDLHHHVLNVDLQRRRIHGCEVREEGRDETVGRKCHVGLYQSASASVHVRVSVSVSVSACV